MDISIIRVSIAAKHNLIRKSLRSCISQMQGIAVHADVSSGEDLSNDHYPESGILVYYVDVPDADSVAQVRMLKARYEGIRVLVLSVHTGYETIHTLLDEGIYAFLPGGTEPEELREAIAVLSQGRLYRNTILTDTLYWKNYHAAYRPSAPQGTPYTEKQIRILQLLWEEKSTQEIADEIFLSVSAVDKIKQQLKEKTGAGSVIGLIKVGIRQGIISTDQPTQAAEGRVDW